MTGSKGLLSLLAGGVAVLPLTAGAEPLTPGNLLVTSNNELIELTLAGIPVQQYAVPNGDGDPFDGPSRDLFASADGRAHVYHGTFKPALQTLDPGASTWSAMTYPGWSTSNVVGYGGVAAFEKYVFVTDLMTGGEVDYGIVRFDVSGGAPVQVKTAEPPIDLTIGLDGYLYSLGHVEDVVEVYHPVALKLVRSISLAKPCRAIAVNAAGQIFCGSLDGDLRRFDGDGAELVSMPMGAGSLADVDLDADGHVVVGSANGPVVVTDEAFANPSSFKPGQFDIVTFVAFVTPGTPATVVVVGGGGDGGAGGGGGDGGAGGGGGGDSASVGDGGSRPGDRGGCGCSLSGRDKPPTLSGLVLLLGLCAGRRRRHHPR